MLEINKHIAKDLARLAELKRLKNRQTQMASLTTLDEETRRSIIIGGMVASFFPEVLQFRPQKTEDENHVEFAQLRAFLSLLARDAEYFEQLMEKANTVCGQRSL